VELGDVHRFGEVDALGNGELRRRFRMRRQLGLEKLLAQRRSHTRRRHDVRRLVRIASELRDAGCAVIRAEFGAQERKLFFGNRQRRVRVTCITRSTAAMQFLPRVRSLSRELSKSGVCDKVMEKNFS
jgi:hypothetical protein